MLSLVFGYVIVFVRMLLYLRYYDYKYGNGSGGVVVVGERGGEDKYPDGIVRTFARMSLAFARLFVGGGQG